jgi:hypothetical protein
MKKVKYKEKGCETKVSHPFQIIEARNLLRSAIFHFSFYIIHCPYLRLRML